MEPLSVALVVGFGILGSYRLWMYLYGPNSTTKLAEDNEVKFKRLLDSLDADINSAIDNFNKWEGGDKILAILNSEEDMKRAIHDAHESKKHFIEVKDKYIRLQERFLNNRTKLSETIRHYNRYLCIRIKQRNNAGTYSKLVELGGMTFEEALTKANETRIILNECERKLDVLLNS